MHIFSRIFIYICKRSKSNYYHFPIHGTFFRWILSENRLLLAYSFATLDDGFPDCILVETPVKLSTRRPQSTIGRVVLIVGFTIFSYTRWRRRRSSMSVQNIWDTEGEKNFRGGMSHNALLWFVRVFSFFLISYRQRNGNKTYFYCNAETKHTRERRHLTQINFAETRQVFPFCTIIGRRFFRFFFFFHVIDHDGHGLLSVNTILFYADRKKKKNATKKIKTYWLEPSSL